MDTVVRHKGKVIHEPKFVRTLMNDPRMGWLWLVLRVWLGWEWVSASLDKITNPAWVSTGVALKGYWANAIVVPASGRPAIAFAWYRDFIQSMLNAGAYVWFAKLIAYGEFLVGVALILGAFTGVAAFLGGFMNWNYMMAGSASINPMLFVIAVGLILAWKVAGYIGADYFLLPLIGTPWRSTEAETARQPAGGLVPEPEGSAAD